jgi:hypothetical protein
MKLSRCIGTKMKATKHYEEKPQWLRNRDRIDQQMQDDSIIAASEFNWRKAAEEAVRRIVANHYCPKMPSRKSISNSRAKRVNIYVN